MREYSIVGHALVHPAPPPGALIGLATAPRTAPPLDDHPRPRCEQLTDPFPVAENLELEPDEVSPRFDHDAAW